MDVSGFCLWDSGCRKKVRFSHATHACMRIRRIVRSGNGLGVESLAACRCQFCGGFHIGHARCDQDTHSKRREQI